MDVNRNAALLPRRPRRAPLPLLQAPASVLVHEMEVWVDRNLQRASWPAARVDGGGRCLARR